MKPKTWALPKFKLLVKDCHLGPLWVAGLLEYLWYLAATFEAEAETPGQLPGRSAEELLAGCEMPRVDALYEAHHDGEFLHPEEIVAALVNRGWLECYKDGFVVHDWNDHKPSYLKNRERQRKYRLSRDNNAMSRDNNAMSRDNTRACAHSDSDSDSDSDSEEEKRNTVRRFAPPSISEVSEYCQERGYKIDPEQFWNFYESKGWMVGKTKMKKWKAALANWAKRSNGQTETDEVEVKWQEMLAKYRGNENEPD